MFIDSWGPYQLGGLLTYPLFALYDYVLEPVLTTYGVGFVLYCRFCYQVVRLLIAFYLYKTIKKTSYERGAFITALAYYLLFISFKNFSYKSLCDFGVILFICWMFRYIYTENNLYFFLMGIATCVMILAYPTMIIFPLFVVVCLFILINKGHELLKPTIIYILTCVVIGALVIIYLQLTSGINNIIPQLAYIEDSAYKDAIYVRLGKMLLSYFAFFVVAYVPVVVIKLMQHYKEIDDSLTHIILSIYWVLFMILIVFIRLESVSSSRFVYGCLVVFWWFPFLIEKREAAVYYNRMLQNQ